MSRDPHALPVDRPRPPVDRPHQSAWYWVLCLTGVDYFSTLAYQPSIAFAAAGRLAPFATLFLVLVTLLGAVPIYRYVAGKSFHGQGSVAMLERLVRGWPSKLLVLGLLGFSATDFIITMTLSAADATEHLLHNPLWDHAPGWLHGKVLLTSLLLISLGALFLRGFREVIGVAVVVVGLFLALNAIVLIAGLITLGDRPELLSAWWSALASGNYDIQEGAPAFRGWGGAVLLSVLLFPKLALGLSGFETRVAVMPLIAGDPGDDPQHPVGRIRNTRHLLLTSAVIMSVYLLASSLVTVTLIPAAELHAGGKAANRVLAFLAHGDGQESLSPLFGEAFGTLYFQSPLISVTSHQGRFVVSVQRCTSIAPVLTWLALELSHSSQTLEIQFGWSDESPLRTNLSFVLFGEGNIPWRVHDLIRRSQTDPALRPRVIIG